MTEPLNNSVHRMTDTQIADDLRRRMDALEWKAGERIPSRRQLATHYKCTTAKIDRAISILNSEKRLRAYGSGGTLVLKDGELPPGHPYHVFVIDRSGR